MTVTTTPAYRWRWLALVAVLAAEIMDVVDGTVVGIAAPSIRAELGGGGDVIQWVAAGYTLAFAAGLITGGRLGDLYGRRRMFLLGLIGFVAASALCGLATSPGMLIGFRVAQGLLGAMLIPRASASSRPRSRPTTSARRSARSARRSASPWSGRRSSGARSSPGTWRAWAGARSS